PTPRTWCRRQWSRRTPVFTPSMPGPTFARGCSASWQTAARNPSAELAVLEAMGDDEVRDAIHALPEAQRLVVYYADIEGFRYKEIAEILDVPIGTVMSRLHRGRANLRALLMDVAAGR